ncbi:hypothetical protein SAMN05192552_10152 [Natrinema hispanicum]|uniref:Uncharacterized protein n=1 Tax=Natrinema hispanicum TaxID=392421 RepID=A0A1I0I0U6_9EURY|nr:hypothetical protein SAMN05192552_10152 [Natrinema hispanicum]SET90076.1 hypothetical protein SAMN04488694_1162 [Natrinema hispanicum]
MELTELVIALLMLIVLYRLVEGIYEGLRGYFDGRQ